MTQAALLSSLRAAWQSIYDRYPIGFDAFVKALDDWEIYPIDIDGYEAGAMFVNGPEIHACVLPKFKGRWFNKKQLRILNQVIEKHGYAQTSATTEEGRVFVERLGFKPYGELFRRYKWD